MMHKNWIGTALLFGGALLACAQPARETELVPETRDGLFYLQYTEAQAVAQAESKGILLDLWRPG